MLRLLTDLTVGATGGFGAVVGRKLGLFAPFTS